MAIREATSETRRARETAFRRWKDRLAVPLVAIASLLGFAIGARDCSREPDRHVVASQVREWERTIRSRRPDLRLFVDGSSEPGDEAATRETRRQALGDFERLGRLDDFGITDILVEVDGDKALATYRIRGVAHAKGESAPRGGQLQFMRWKGRCRSRDTGLSSDHGGAPATCSCGVRAGSRSRGGVTCKQAL